MEGVTKMNFLTLIKKQKQMKKRYGLVTTPLFFV